MKKEVNKKSKIMIAIDIIRYIFGTLVIVTALQYSDWRLVLFLISGLLFYPFIYSLVSKKVYIKYWIQIFIAIVFIIFASIIEIIYIEKFGLYELTCENGKTLVGDECLSCPEGYKLNIEDKSCLILDDYLEEIIIEKLDSINITSVETNKIDDMYEITLNYNKDFVYLHISVEDAISYASKIINMGEIREITSVVHIKINENNKLKYNIDINNFNNLTLEGKIEDSIVLMDAEGKIINKTIDQVKDEYIKEYKDTCKTYDYKTIFRYAEDYKGKDVKYTGKVVQVIADDIATSYRVNVTKDKWGYYDDTIYVTFIDLNGTTPRILEDDIITFYGTLDDLYTYETVLGATVTIPSVIATYIDIK